MLSEFPGGLSQFYVLAAVGATFCRAYFLFNVSLEQFLAGVALSDFPLVGFHSFVF